MDSGSGISVAASSRRWRLPVARRCRSPARPPPATRAEREGGHLTWIHDGALFAAPFDLATLAVNGPAVPVVPSVLSSTASGNAQVQVSHTGTLVYLPGGEDAPAYPLDWLAHDGKT